MESGVLLNFLKELGFKKFSSPFDGLYLSSINDIIYLLKNKIELNNLIHTENNPNLNYIIKNGDIDQYIKN